MKAEAWSPAAERGLAQKLRLAVPEKELGSIPEEVLWGPNTQAGGVTQVGKEKTASKKTLKKQKTQQN